MVDRKKTVVGRKHAALENMYWKFMVGLSPTCPNTRAATASVILLGRTPDAYLQAFRCRKCFLLENVTHSLKKTMTIRWFFAQSVVKSAFPNVIAGDSTCSCALDKGWLST